jgi:hypothetical protein
VGTRRAHADLEDIEYGKKHGILGASWRNRPKSGYVNAASGHGDRPTSDFMQTTLQVRTIRSKHNSLNIDIAIAAFNPMNKSR